MSKFEKIFIRVGLAIAIIGIIVELYAWVSMFGWALPY